MKVRLLKERAEIGSIFSSIKQSCSDYIAAATESNTDYILLRGMQRSTLGKIPIKTDREPRNSAVTTAGIFNLYVEKRFGIERIRNRSLFCTPSEEIIHKYGTPHFVFPVNGSKYFFNPEVSDSMLAMNNLFQNVQQSLFPLSEGKLLDDFMLFLKYANGQATLSDLANENQAKLILRTIMEDGSNIPGISNFQMTEDPRKCLQEIQHSTEVSIIEKYYYALPFSTVMSLYSTELGQDPSMLSPRDLFEYLDALI